MYRAIRKIDQFLWMTDHERCVSACVAGIGRRRRIPILQRRRQPVIVDGSCPATVANSLELAVPSRGRQPHFDLDVGVGRRGERGGDTTERRQLGDPSPDGRIRRSWKHSDVGEFPRRHFVGRSNRRIGEGQRRQPLARSDHVRRLTLNEGRQNNRRPHRSQDLHEISFPSILEAAVPAAADWREKAARLRPGSQSAKRGFGSAFRERGDPHPHAQSSLRRVFWNSLEFACLRAAPRTASSRQSGVDALKPQVQVS